MDVDIEALKLSLVRKYRDQLLAASDWVDLPNSPVPANLKPDWIQYRQYLRDLTTKIDLSGDVWTDEILKSKVNPPPPLK